jgi:hypothetical protein
MFPFDLIRFTCDAWTFTIEGYTHRLKFNNPDQPCIYCRGTDTGYSPRRMHLRIKYWNLWMPKLLHPNLGAFYSPGRLKKIPVCKTEGGHLFTPKYIPFVALILTVMWTGLFLLVLKAYAFG